MLLDVLFFTVNLLILLATSGLIVASLPTPSRIVNRLALLCLNAGEIVLITTVLSEFKAIGRPGFMAGHVFFLGLALVLWDQRGRPTLFTRWKISYRKIQQAIQREPVLDFYAVLVALLCLVNLTRSLITSPVGGDTFLYHLPRAFMLIQNGTVHHFNSFAIYMNEYPPNGSIYYMWLMLMRGSFDYRYHELFQYLAGLMIALSIVELVRLAGFSRAAGIFAGLTWLTFPLVLVQMVTVEVDMLTAAAGTCFVLFTLYSVQQMAQGVPLYQNHAILYTGVAFGLAMGTKYTAPFLIPGVTLVTLGYSFLQLRLKVLSLWISLGVSVVIGFGLFGVYNYLLNYQDFGDFISSRPVEAASAIGIERTEATAAYYDEYFSTGGNFARYLYQTMDWAVIPTANSVFTRWNEQGFREADHLLDLKTEAVPEFKYEAFTGQRLAPNQTGFGLVAYLCTLISPVIGVYLLVRKRWLAAGYIVIGLGWLVGLAAISPWDQNKIRYLVVMMPYIAAGVLPVLYHRSTVLLIGVIAVLIGLDASLSVYDRDFMRELDQQNTFHMGVLDDVLPDDARIGLVDNYSPYVVMGWLSGEYQFIRGDYAALLRAEVDVLLQEWTPGACATDDPHFVMIIPETRHCVFVADPAQFRENFEAVYGWQPVDGTRLQAASPEKLLIQTEEHMLKLYLPGDLQQNRRYDLVPPLPLSHTAICNGYLTDVVTNTEKTSLYLRQSDQAAEGEFQICTVGLNTPADLSAVAIYAEPVPTPIADAPFDLRFDAALTFAGFSLPAGYEFTRCEAVPAATLWQVNAPTSHYYSLTLLLVSQATGKVITEAERLFIRPEEMPGEMTAYRQVLALPCDLPEGLYDLQMHVYDPDTLLKVPVTYPDGTPYQTDQLHLTTIWVRP